MSQFTLPRIIQDRLDQTTALACPGVCSPGLLVGLSGGPDSVALLKVAAQWGQLRNQPVAAAHLNHNLRGTHSDADARFCQELCQQLEIPLFLKDEDPRPLARSRGAGLEEAARILRHSFFSGILADEENLHCVATGHHRNDQVETVIMRLFRGTGPDGMAGILPVSGAVIHPLLEVRRSEILAWLEQENQPWRQDASNLDGDNTRSRLRRELLPMVQSIFGQGADQTAARLAELWQADLDFLNHTAQETLNRLTGSSTDELPIDQWLALQPGLAVRVLRLWLQKSGLVPTQRLESVHLMNISTWLREGTSGTGIDLPGGGRLERVFDRLRLVAGGQKAVPMRNAGDFRILVASCEGPQDPENHGREEAFGREVGLDTWNLTCPSSVLKGNLRVRNWQQGDRIRSLGLDGSRKLSDLFREQQLNAEERNGTLVVEDDEGILWVVGLARAERTRLLQAGEPVVTISVALRRPRGRS